MKRLDENRPGQYYLFGPLSQRLIGEGWKDKVVVIVVKEIIEIVMGTIESGKGLEVQSAVIVAGEEEEWKEEEGNEEEEEEEESPPKTTVCQLSWQQITIK